MVLPRVTAQADRDRPVAARSHVATGLLSSRLSRRLVCAGKTPGVIRAILGGASGRLGRLSQFYCRGALLHSWLPLDQKTHSVATPKSTDRYLCLHRRDSSCAAGGHGTDHPLRLGRTI